MFTYTMSGTTETGKVRQESEYIGKEVTKDYVTTVQKPRNRISAQKVLDSTSYIMYRFADDFSI